MISTGPKSASGTGDMTWTRVYVRSGTLPAGERHEHQAGAVRGRHERRPEGEITCIDRHAAEPRMARPHQAGEPEPEQQRRHDPLQRAVIHRLPRGEREQQRRAHRRRVSEGKRRERAPHGARAPLPGSRVRRRTASPCRG